MKLFSITSFTCPAFKAEISKHLFEATVFILQIYHLFDIRGFHTTQLRFPVVITGFRDTSFNADILNGTSGFDRLQNVNDLVFGESALRMVISSQDIIRMSKDL